VRSRTPFVGWRSYLGHSSIPKRLRRGQASRPARTMALKGLRRLLSMTTDEFMELMKVLKDIDRTMKQLVQFTDKVAVKLELPPNTAPGKRHG
jgi:hypothetical protein